MPAGYVIAESVRVGARLEGFSFTLIRVERHLIEDATTDQPSVWTMIHFEFPEHEAERLADALAEVLDGPWYANFDSDGDTFVIFPSRVVRYRREDDAARAEAEAYARTLGIPDDQLDW
ncbi:MAG: hypothetical protein H0U21_02550 [Acidimicrobiia bacterium]|nr:hypothetical protein [Acidimicrobiia bacterium]